MEIARARGTEERVRVRKLKQIVEGRKKKEITTRFSIAGRVIKVEEVREEREEDITGF